MDRIWEISCKTLSKLKNRPDAVHNIEVQHRPGISVRHRKWLEKPPPRKYS